EEMSRITRSGGKVVITDMDKHDFDFLEDEHYDRWKGFDRSDLQSWYKTSGLKNIQVLSTEEKCSTESTSGDKASITVFVAIGEKI
ncbi:MAG: SAM-dependent methyltransferase, partial [Candidatus Kariarchaeaceae archaeon]